MSVGASWVIVMAQEKKQTSRKRTPTRKQRRWLIPKILLICAYGVVIAFLGAIFVMKKELRRLGVFSSEQTAVSPTSPAQIPPASSAKAARQEETTTSEAPTTEVTQEEKKQLEDILRAKTGK